MFAISSTESMIPINGTSSCRRRYPRQGGWSGTTREPDSSCSSRLLEALNTKKNSHITSITARLPPQMFTVAASPSFSGSGFGPSAYREWLRLRPDPCRRTPPLPPSCSTPSCRN
eukprot:749483-Hanusia_phi.AAC.2